MKKFIKKIEKYYKSRKSSLFFYPLAELLYEEGAKEKAFDLLVEGVSKFPKYTLALIKIAQMLIDEEKYAASEAYLETVLSINNANVLAWELLALSYEKQEKYNEAIKAYEMLLALEPQNRIKSKMLSLAALAKPSVDEVKEVIETTNVNQQLRSKKTLIEPDDLLVVDVEKSDVKMSPDDNFKNADSQELQINKKSFEFEEIPMIELEEDDSLNIAKLYVEQGYIEDAKNLYKEILEKNPQNSQAQGALKALEAADEKE